MYRNENMLTLQEPRSTTPQTVALLDDPVEYDGYWFIDDTDIRGINMDETIYDAKRATSM